MCGRYNLLLTSEQQQDILDILREVQELVEKRNSKNPKATVNTGMIFPTNLVPIITEDGPEAMFWGYPGWPKESETKKNADGTPYINKPKAIINTRFETATNMKEKNMWRDSLYERRCLIPTTGFYEWKTQKNQKKKMYLFYLSKGTTYIAGIYKVFHDEYDEAWPHFSMMTTIPNKSIEKVHDRMPVVVLPDEKEEWLLGNYLAFADRNSVKLIKKTGKKAM